MKFVYNKLYAFFYGKLASLPLQNIHNSKRYFGKFVFVIALITSSFTILPGVVSAQSPAFFNKGTNMLTGGNYLFGFPTTNTTDILITAPATNLLNISGGTLNAQSLNLISPSTYILGDSTGTASTLALGNPSFTNSFSSGANDAIYLAGGANLTIQPKVSTATASLGITLGGTNNFNIGTASVLTIKSTITGGSFGLNKTGAGTLVLPVNAGNTYTGTTYLSQGALSIITAALPSTTAITLDGGILQANSANLVIPVSSNVNNPITLGAGGGTINNNGFNIALISPISGTGSLTKIGSGILTIEGGVSGATYTGNTFIQQGTLKDTAQDNVLPATTVLYFGQALSPNIGNFDLRHNETVAGLSSIAGTNVSAATNGIITTLSSGSVVLTIAGSGNDTLGNGTAVNSGIISGGAIVGVTMSGSGLQILGGVNTYSGTTTFSAGELRYALPAGTTQTLGTASLNGGTLGTSGSGASSSITFTSLVLANNSTISLGSAVHTVTFTTAGTFTGGKTLTITGWQGNYLGGSGTGAKIFVGATSTSLTTAQLAQIKFVNGATTYNAAQLSTGEIVPFVFVQETDLFINSDMHVASNYTGLAIPTNQNDVLITTPVTTPDISNGNVVAQSINVKNGTAYTIIDASATARSLTLGNTTAFTNSISSVANDIVSLSGSSSLTIQPSIGASLGIVLASSGNFNIATGSTFTDDSAAISGANSFTKTGNGKLVLLGANTYTGSTIINGGTIALNNGNSNFGAYPGSFVANKITINGGTLQAFAVPAAAPFSLNANRGIVLGTGGATFDNNGFSITDNAAISGSGALTKIGSGTLILAAATSTYTGNTNIQQDTARGGASNGMSAASILYLGNASHIGTLDLNGFTETVAGLNSVTGTTGAANTVTSTTGGTLTIAGSGSYNFGSNTAADSAFIKGANVGINMSGSGLQVLGGINTYTGNTTITSGELRFKTPAGKTQTLGSAVFAGGKLSTTGSGAGSTLSFTSINISAGNSILVLDTAISQIVKFTTFLNSPGTTVTITSWQGTGSVPAVATASTGAKVFIGTSAFLNAAQLGYIKFLVGGVSYAAAQLATGEIVPVSTLSISTNGGISPTTYCAGANVVIHFTYSPNASFTSAIFTAQLSNASGSFASPVTIGSVVSDISGAQTITATIPVSTGAGTNYLVRVVSASPTVTGATSSSTLTITVGNKWVGGTTGHLTDWNTATNWCSNNVPDINTNVTIPGSLTYYPVITATSYVDSITISSGAFVTVTGGTLSIHGAITNSGTITATAGTIQLAGSLAQAISGSMFASSTLYNLIDSNTNSTGLSLTSSALNITNQVSFGYPTAKLSTNGLLVLVSNATTTASIAQIAESGTGTPLATISGNVTVQRYYPAHRRWRFVTAPVQSSGAPTISASWQEGGQSIAGSISNLAPGFGTTISGPTVGAFNVALGYDQSANNSASIAYLTGASLWYAIPNTYVPVTNYQGYMLFVRGDRTFPVYTGTSTTPAGSATLRTTGTVNTGRVTVPVNSGFTAVGNPYPSTINFNNVYANSTGISSNSFSLWDPNIGSAANVANGTGGWVTLLWNGAGYDASPDPHGFDGFDVNGDIQSGAAFAVDGLGSGSVIMDESNKVTGTTNNHLYLFRPSTDANPLAKLHTTLYATDTTNANAKVYLADGVLNEFSSDFTNDLNWNKDVKKLFSFNERISISKNTQSLSIQKGAPAAAGDTIHFNVASLKQSAYQFVLQTESFTRPELRASLIDSFTHTATPILLGDTSVTVNFVVTSAPASYAANRFSVVFTATPPATATYSNVTAVVQQNKSINVQWDVTNQTNTKSYVVERSTDGTNFAVVDTTLATSSDVASYTYNWIDTNAVYGKNYYRIYTIGDNGGIPDTSNVASAILDAGIIVPIVSTPTIKVYPNPVTDGTLYVSLANLAAGNYGLKIISEAGQVVYGSTKYHGLNDGPIAIPFGKDVSKGIYILQIIDPSGSKTKVTFENQ